LSPIIKCLNFNFVQVQIFHSISLSTEIRNKTETKTKIEKSQYRRQFYLIGQSNIMAKLNAKVKVKVLIEFDGANENKARCGKRYWFG